MMDMMKNLYDEGDDNMKRMINKAWVITIYYKLKFFSQRIRGKKERCQKCDYDFESFILIF